MTPPHHAAAVFPDLFRDDVLRIETLRLWLRWPTPADAQALHSVAWREALVRNTAAWPQPFPAGEPGLWISEARAGNAAGERLDLAITEKSRPGRLIGLLGVRSLGRADELSLGFLLDVEHQGKGVMTEAVRALAGVVFRFTGTKRIHGSSGIANVASRRVLEKAGFCCVERSSARRGEAGLVETGKPVIGCPSLELHRTAWSAGAFRLRKETGAAEVPCGCAA